MAYGVFFCTRSFLFSCFSTLRWGQDLSGGIRVPSAPSLGETWPKPAWFWSKGPVQGCLPRPLMPTEHMTERTLGRLQVPWPLTEDSNHRSHSLLYWETQDLVLAAAGCRSEGWEHVCE